MKIAYLDTARSDLVWFRLYYRSVFPEGVRGGATQYLKAVRNIREYPHIGRPAGRDGAREYPVARTPFLIIYRVTESRIEVMRLWDSRRDPKPVGFNEEQMELA